MSMVFDSKRSRSLRAIAIELCSVPKIELLLDQRARRPSQGRPTEFQQ